MGSTEVKCRICDHSLRRWSLLYSKSIVSMQASCLTWSWCEVPRLQHELPEGQHVFDVGPSRRLLGLCSRSIPITHLHSTQHSIVMTNQYDEESLLAHPPIVPHY